MLKLDFYFGADLGFCACLLFEGYGNDKKVAALQAADDLFLVHRIFNAGNLFSFMVPGDVRKPGHYSSPSVTDRASSKDVIPSSTFFIADSYRVCMPAVARATSLNF